MLSVTLASAHPRAAQAADCGPYVVAIAESRPREADEPRHLIRRAIWAIKAPKAVSLSARKRTKLALKAAGLIYAASLRAKVIGGWSLARTYDPLPDFHELRNLATRRLGLGCGNRDPVTQFHGGLNTTIRRLSEVTASQRTGA